MKSLRTRASREGLPFPEEPEDAGAGGRQGILGTLIKKPVIESLHGNTFKEAELRLIFLEMKGKSGMKRIRPKSSSLMGPVLEKKTSLILLIL